LFAVVELEGALLVELEGALVVELEGALLVELEGALLVAGSGTRNPTLGEVTGRKPIPWLKFGEALALGDGAPTTRKPTPLLVGC
jgi:hypothetical protein